MEPTLSLKIDGHPYSLRPRQLDAWQSATFEAAAGLSVEGMLSVIEHADDATLVDLARFVFLCEVQAETGATFEEVCKRIRYDSDFGKLEALGFGDDVEDEDDDVELEEGPAPADPYFGPAGSTPGGPGSSPAAEPSSSPI